MSSQGFIKECCTVPPVQAEYTPKGSYGEVAGLKTYIVGPESAKAAVVVVYDVFAYSPQILQGADMLASAGFRVYMPDFFVGNPPDMKWFDGTEEGAKKREAYFSTFPGNPGSQSKPIQDVVAAVKANGQSKVGAVGACWGYKAIVLSEGIKDMSAAAGIHPSMIAAEDVAKIDVPLCLLASKGEDAEIIKAIYEGVEKKNPGTNFMKIFDTMVHGWMAARADFKDPEVVKKFEEGYTDLANFFGTHSGHVHGQ